MEPISFICPHCSRQFAAGQQPAGQAVICPHCGGAMALPEVSPTAPPSPGDVPPELPGSPAPPEAAGALDFLQVDTPVVPRSRRARAAAAASTAREPVRRLSRDEKERRRMIRNAVLLSVGSAVLIVTALVLSRL